MKTTRTAAWLIMFTAVAVAPVCSASEPKPAAPTPPKLSWQKTDRSVALLNHGKMVWEHVHDKQIGKPYMRLALLDGTELTRPWPFPKDYPKNDHTWHRALWWSWKTIDGVNYWEGNQTGTEPTETAVETHADGSAEIAMSVAYHTPGNAPVVLEKRTIRVSAPDAAGSYFIAWDAAFTAAGKKEVRFGQNSYGGFALRLAAECCGDPKRKIPGWTFCNSDGQANCNDKPARWVSYQGKFPNGEAACIAMFDHRENPRHPSLWQSRANYPYLNPSLTCKEDYVLAPGKTLRLRYGVLVHAGTADAKTIEDRWRTFAGVEQTR